MLKGMDMSGYQYNVVVAKYTWYNYLTVNAKTPWPEVT